MTYDAGTTLRYMRLYADVVATERLSEREVGRSYSVLTSLRDRASEVPEELRDRRFRDCLDRLVTNLGKVAHI